NVLLPISSSHPKFNAYQPDYYKEANVLGVLNIESSDIEMLSLGYPPVYQDYNCIPQFSNILFNNYKKNIVLGYEADSLLYIGDRKGNILEKFGNDGRNMERNYPEVRDFNNYVEDYEERLNYGYFTYVYYDENAQLLFRGYQKDKPHQDTDGLQIYAD